MHYRREVDGLRAIAVLPVILFHAGFSVFSGGYIGVDVFFVISGYLITSILISELEQGNFSIARFYERRARRILPALFFVMAACLPFAYMWMLPTQLKDFAQSLVAVVFFASNILFWRESGYFAADAELKPLLHTWSLAVEEQYYLLFPVFLLLTWRFGRSRVFWSVVVISVASLLIAEWGWRNKPSANFYLAPTRAWELLAGSICAFLSVGKAQRSSNVLSIIGLGLIIFSIFVYDANTPFPSVYTLAPVVGTALVILFAEKETWVARLLSLRGFVGIGLISYSAYLWHQPLFAFARLRSLTEPSHALMAALAAASLLLAWATWYWVEQAFRKPANPLLATRRSVFVVSGVIGVIFIAFGLTGHFGRGFEWRFGDDLLRYSIAENDHTDGEDGCFFGSADALPTHPLTDCMYYSSNATMEVLLVGDSHALAISEALGSALANIGIGYYDVGYSGCVPLRGLRRFDATIEHDCATFNDDVIAFARTNYINTIVLTGRFPLYLRGDRFDNREGGVENGGVAWIDLVGQTDSDWDDADRRERVLSAYEQRIRELAEEFNVVLVYPIPEAGWHVPNQAFKSAFFNDGNATVTTSFAVYRERTNEVNALFDRLVIELDHIHAARVQDVLCSETTGRCVNADENGIYYYDDDHLSRAGARLVAPTIVDAIMDATN
jgi:peptidoglycan/LPS O-acetylase OafA/YrhL